MLISIALFTGLRKLAISRHSSDTFGKSFFFGVRFIIEKTQVACEGDPCAHLASLRVGPSCRC